MFSFQMIAAILFIFVSSNAYAWTPIYLVDCKANDYASLNADGTLSVNKVEKDNHIKEDVFTVDLETGMVRFTNSYKETYKIIQKGNEVNDTVMVLDNGYSTDKPVDDFIRIRHWQVKEWNDIIFIKYSMDSITTGKCSIIR